MVPSWYSIVIINSHLHCISLIFHFLSTYTSYSDLNNFREKPENSMKPWNNVSLRIKDCLNFWKSKLVRFSATTSPWVSDNDSQFTCHFRDLQVDNNLRCNNHIYIFISKRCSSSIKLLMQQIETSPRKRFFMYIFTSTCAT